MLFLTCCVLSYALDALAKLCQDPKPAIMIASPDQGAAIKGDTDLDIFVDGIDADVIKVDIVINGGPPKTISELPPSANLSPKQRRVKQKLSTIALRATDALILREGPNTIQVKAWDKTGGCKEQTRIVSASAGTFRVLVVGISRYETIRQLNFADKDAISFSEHVRKNFGLVDNKNLFVLTDKHANRRSILKHLDEFGKSETSDTLIVFFSGHGFYSTSGTGTGKVFLMPWDAELGYESTFLEQEEIIEKIGAARAGKKLFFFDACFSGSEGSKNIGWANDPSGSKGIVDLGDIWNKLNAQGIGGVLSSKSTQPSWEDAELDGGHGVFTYYLLESFSKADTNNDRMVTLNEAYEYLKTKVSTFTEKKKPSRQDPVLQVQGSSILDLPLGLIETKP